MRHVEFAAELTILIVEGPQDKKSAIDLYYVQYKDSFPAAKLVEKHLKEYMMWIKQAIPNLARTRFRKPVDLYSLIGALHRISSLQGGIGRIKPKEAGKRLCEFEERLKVRERLSGDAMKYVIASSQQTDNVTPRTTRINILDNIISGK